MSEIKLNYEIITALQNCKDAKSIISLAKAKGIEISGEQAEKLFAILQNDKLNDEDLEKVTGGGDIISTEPIQALLQQIKKELRQRPLFIPPIMRFKV